MKTDLIIIYAIILQFITIVFTFYTKGKKVPLTTAVQRGIMGGKI